MKNAGDFDTICAIVNDAATAYKGVIPTDRWHDPYMPKAELRAAIGSGVAFWGCEMDGVSQRQIEASVVLGDRRWSSRIHPGDA